MPSLSSCRISLYLGLWFALAVSLLAQAWRSDPQRPTGEDLWSVAYADGRMIAVGKRGTVVHFDYESSLWQPRRVDTEAWLVGVAYGAGRWVIVGDEGRIFTSDDRGESWVAQISGTTQRLNAVAHGDGVWLAVGEAGTVLTSPDAVNWTVRAQLGTGFLRGLAFGQGKFLVGGAAGALYTTTDGMAFTRVVLATQGDVEATAISANRFFVAGSRGLLAWSEAAEGPWQVYHAPAGTTFRGMVARADSSVSALGDQATFDFSQTATNGWVRGNYDLPFLATAATLGGEEVLVVGLGGAIARASLLRSVSVGADLPETNRLSSSSWTNVVYGSPLKLTASVFGGASSQTYQWRRDDVDLPGATGAELAFAAVTPDVSGRYTVLARLGSTTVTSLPKEIRVVPGGRPEVIDPAYNAPAGLRMSLLAVQSDGKLVGIDTSGSELGSLVRRILRLNTDGSLDSGFTGAVVASGNEYLTRLSVLRDGRIMVAGSFTMRAGVPNPGFARYLSNGTFDSSFQPDRSLDRIVNGPLVASDGRIYVETSTGVVRLLPDGALDGTFPGPIKGKLEHVDTADRLIVYTTASGLNNTSVGRYTRFLPNGARDDSYQVAFTRNSYPINGNSYGNGWAGDDLLGFTYGLIGKFGGPSSSFRLDATGKRPEGYRSWQTSVAGNVYQTTAVYRPDGGVWIYGGGVYQSAEPHAYSPLGIYQPEIYAARPDLADIAYGAFGADGSIYGELNSAQGRRLARIRPIVGRAGRLTNLSVRAHVASAAEPLIVGFVTAGSGDTQALVRAIGPALGGFGVEGVLNDPQLTLMRDGSRVAGNDNWDASLASRFGGVGAFPLTAGSRDAALEATIGAGNYTAVVQPTTGDSGVTLVELYESAEALAPRRFTNVSARGTVAAGRPLIVGFTITGQRPATVLIRAAGPALAGFGVTGALGDPALKLHRGTTALWENDNWPQIRLWDPLTFGASIDPVEQVGAFFFPRESKDAAMVVTLAPGSYTAQVSGAGSTSGVALVEVYEVP